MVTPITEPEQARVQLNLNVSWAFREHLREIATERNLPLATMVRNALLAEFGEPE